MVEHDNDTSARRAGLCPDSGGHPFRKRRYLFNDILMSLSPTSSLTGLASLSPPSSSSFSSSSSAEIYQREFMANNTALVPGPYWHTRGLEFTSWQGKLHEGEEENVRISGARAHRCESQQSEPLKDELITLYMSSTTEVSGFVEQRSVLARSPTFAGFFESASFTPGMATCIWLGREHPAVVKIALYYLLLHNPVPAPALSSIPSSTNSLASSSTAGPSSLTDATPPHDDGEFRIPSLECYSQGDHVYLKIRLYFLAKRLRLPRLEDIAYGMLRAGERRIGAREVVDLAEMIYDRDEEEDARIRLFLNQNVEMNLRALLNFPAWRALLCTARPALAADMFELTSTLLLNGSAPTYPLSLPRVNSIQECPSFSPLGQNVTAVAMRHFYSEDPGDLCIVRGEILTDCWLSAEWIVGTDQNGERGYFPRDWVELVAKAETSETGEEVGEGVGRKAETVLGIVPPKDGAAISGGARKRWRFAALKGWRRGKR